MKFDMIANTRRDIYQADVIMPKDIGRLPLTIRGGGTGKVSRITSAVLASIFALLTIFIATLSTAAKADANPITDWLDNTFCASATFFNEPTVFRNGLTSLGIATTSLSPLAAPNNAALKYISFDGDKNLINKSHTAYERYGMSGTTWTVYRGENKIDAKTSVKDRPAAGTEETDARLQRRADAGCFPVIEIAGTYAANSVFEFTKFTTSVSGWVLSQALANTIPDALNDSVAKIINGTPNNPGLRDTIFFQFLSIMVIVAVLYVFQQGVIQRRTSQSFGSLVWIICATLTSSALLFNPALLPSVSTALMTGFSNEVLAGVSVSGNGETSLCTVAKPKFKNKASRIRTQERENAVRTANCIIWETFVFAPWVVGQYGAPYDIIGADFGNKNGPKAPAIDLGDRKVRNWALTQLDAQSIDKYALSQKYSEVASQKRKNWWATLDAMGAPGGAQKYLNTWSGTDPGSRLAVATTSLVASIGGTAVIFVNSMSLIVNGLLQAVLMFFLPFIALLGVHPGFGRRAAMRWLELYIGTILKVISMTVVMAITLAAFGIILAANTLTWGTGVLAIIILSVAILFFRKELLDMVSNIDFGGRGFDRNPFHKAGVTTKGAVVGGALGAAGGIAAAPGAMRVASQLGKSQAVAGLGALASGTGRGMKTGVVHAGGYGANMTATAGKSAYEGIRAKGERTLAQKKAAEERARHEEERALKEQEKRRSQELSAERAAEKESAKAEAEARRRAYEQSPQGVAEKKRREQEEARKRNAKYRQDYEANHRDPEWKKAFVEQYGFTPPNPATHRFAGYGLTKQQLDANPNQKPVSYDDLKRREAERKAREAAPRPRPPKASSPLPTTPPAVRPSPTPSPLPTSSPAALPTASPAALPTGEAPQSFNSEKVDQDLRVAINAEEKRFSRAGAKMRQIRQEIQDANARGDKGYAAVKGVELKKLREEMDDAKDTIRRAKQQLGE